MASTKINWTIKANFYGEERQEFAVEYYSDERQEVKYALFKNETEARNYLAEKHSEGKRDLKFTTRTIFVEEEVEEY